MLVDICLSYAYHQGDEPQALNRLACEYHFCLPIEQVWKREVPGSAFVAIKSSAILEATQQAIFEVLTPGDIDIVRQVIFYLHRHNQDGGGLRIPLIVVVYPILRQPSMGAERLLDLEWSYTCFREYFRAWWLMNFVVNWL